MPINAPYHALPFTADTDMGPFLIVKFGSQDGNCAIAAANTDKLLGVTGTVATAAGQTASVNTDGPCLVTYGGNVTAGDYVTSDANGNAVTATPGAGVNVEILGKAHETGVAGDIRPVKLNIGRIQG